MTTDIRRGIVCEEREAHRLSTEQCGDCERSHSWYRCPQLTAPCDAAGCVACMLELILRAVEGLDERLASKWATDGADEEHL